MAIGERIRCIRKKRGKAQRQLGQAAGFSAASAEIRISQYESGARTPNRAILEKMAGELKVSPRALTVPDIADAESLLFTLFALEDRFGFQICRSGGHLYLILDGAAKQSPELQEALFAWSNYAEMFKAGKVCREEYDNWRYNFSSGEKDPCVSRRREKKTKKQR